MNDTTDPHAVHVDVQQQPENAAIEPAPEWLIGFRRSEFPKGTYTSGPGFGVVFTDRESRTLIVSWDNLSSARDEAIDRSPWGYSFVAKNGWSQLGIMTFQADWFRNDELIAHLVALRDSGFFKRFENVVMTGTSMGAYAATAFASLSPGCTVVAFSPQSTLKKELVPWEKRFSSGRRADWTGPFADGAVESLAAERVFLIYDPHFEPDVQHIERYEGANAIPLVARYSGHKTALFMRRAGLLSTVVKKAVAGTLTEAEFYNIYRRGRDLPWYKHAVLNRIIEGGRERLLPRFAKAVRSTGNEPLARAALARAVEAGVVAAPPTRGAPRAPQPMGPHERRLAQRMAKAEAGDAKGAIEEEVDLYQRDPSLPPLEDVGVLPWQAVNATRRKNAWIF